LGEGEPPFALDGFQPERAVRSRAGENDTDSFLASVVSKRFEKGIDASLPALRLAWTKLQRSIHNGHACIRGNNVELVREDLHAVFDLEHGHGSGVRQERREQTVMFRGQMLHQHERHARVAWQIFEKIREGPPTRPPRRPRQRPGTTSSTRRSDEDVFSEPLNLLPAG